MRLIHPVFARVLYRPHPDAGRFQPAQAVVQAGIVPWRINIKHLAWREPRLGRKRAQGCFV